MVYKREADPTNLFQFRRQPDTTDEDCVRITFEDGSRLYVARQGGRWCVVPTHMPHELAELERTIHGKDFYVPEPHNERRSACVGAKLELEMAELYWRARVTFTTDASIKSIKPSKLPAPAADLRLPGTHVTKHSDARHH